MEYVQGDFLNVVGFPLNHFCKQLGKIYNQSPQSPAHKIKHKDLAMCDGPCAAVSCLSEKTVQPDISNFNSSDSARPERTKNNTAGFPHRLVELLDGFKASKVKKFLSNLSYIKQITLCSANLPHLSDISGRYLDIF